MQPSSQRANDFDSPSKTREFNVFRQLPLFFTVFLILLPHPSWLIVLLRYHLRTLHAAVAFVFHLLATYTLTSLVFASLIVCVSRDPGPVPSGEDRADGSEEIELRHALMFHDEDDNDDHDGPGQWCHTCQAPKPERTHHCCHCGRCVLKMDHHCPWLGSKCIGHRTYPAFFYFLSSITVLSLYIATVSLSALLFAFNNPLSIDESTPVHELFLTAYGLVFFLVIGSFLAYHVYLVSTNQTTVENVSPFMILRHLPPLPPSPTGQKLSNPPLEHELTRRQRNLVRQAHGVIRIYDVGFRKNWTQVFGREGRDDGRSFPRHPRSEEMLARLATELVNIDTNL